MALEVLHRVDADRAWSGVLLRRVLERAGLNPLDEALAIELTYGTLRHRSEVDWALSRFTHTPLGALPSRIRTILRLGAYQLLFLHRIPPQAACWEAVELAKRAGHPGTAGLVNAVMRHLAASPPAPPEDGATAEAIALRHSHPVWLVARWIARYGIEDTRALCAANNRTPPSSIRLNTLRGAPGVLAARLAERGVETAPSVLLPEGRRIVAGAATRRARTSAAWDGHVAAARGAHAVAAPGAYAVALQGGRAGRQAAYDAGWFSPQDEGAMLVARLVAPCPGEMVIDACAAPGGKSTHLAALMENRGRIVACDVRPSKLGAVTRQCVRLGVTIVEARDLDAARLGEAYPRAADRVLVDAPCSGLGVVRRRPEIKWRLRPDDLAELAVRQRRLLDGAAEAVRPGGLLVYSVCTLEPEEGPQIAEAFLARSPGFVAAALAGWPPGNGATAVPPGAATPGRAGTAFLFPHRSDTDGFFVAAFRRAA